MFPSLLVLVSVGLVSAHTYQKKVVFTIPPGKTTCFLKLVSAHKVIKIEYQVLEPTGNLSNLSILFEMLVPTQPPPRAERHVARRERGAVATLRRRGGDARRGGTMIARRRWPAGAHILDATASGPYRFCFDNSFDNVNKKTILFDLTIHPNDSKLRYTSKRFDLMNSFTRSPKYVLPKDLSLLTKPMILRDRITPTEESREAGTGPSSAHVETAGATARTALRARLSPLGAQAQAAWPPALSLPPAFSAPAPRPAPAPYTLQPHLAPRFFHVSFYDDDSTDAVELFGADVKDTTDKNDWLPYRWDMID